MNGIEKRLRDAFGAQAETVRTHDGVHAENARRIRRARTRRLITGPAVVMATAAAVVAAPLTLPRVLDGGPDTLGGDTVAIPGDLVDESTIVTIPGKLPGGATFRPDALGTDGSVVGRTPDHRVFKAGPEDGRLRSLGVRAQAGLATGPGFVTWIPVGEEWELKCRTPDGRVRQIGHQGTTPDQPVLTGGGVIIASDPMDQPWSTTGCGETGESIENFGYGTLGLAKAFSYPTLFVVEPHDDRVLREIDVRTDRVVKEHPMPAGVRPLESLPDLSERRIENGQVTQQFKPEEQPSQPPQPWLAAANDRYFAWAVAGRLSIADRKNWKDGHEIGRVPRITERQHAAARLTAGDRLIAYSTPGGSLIHDPREKLTGVWKGEVLAAGDWLLWRDGSDYRIGRVR